MLTFFLSMQLVRIALNWGFGLNPVSTSALFTFCQSDLAGLNSHS